MKAIHRLSLQAFSCLLIFLSVFNANQALATNLVGRTPGSGTVDAKGAFTYAIPIKATPGPKGVGPHIALNYNSRSGNGIVGVGWSIGGLSSIYRCNLTNAQDVAAGAVTLTYREVVSAFQTVV